MLLKLFIVFFVFFSRGLIFGYDLTIVGQINPADGIGSQPINLMRLLKDEVSINYISSGSSIITTDIEEEIKKIILHPDKTEGDVCILEDVLWNPRYAPYEFVPESKIKIAYSMLEGTEIPSEWVSILNTNFDAVVVPDGFLVKVYQNCGVSIPVFELPLGMNLSPFVEKTRFDRPSSPFVFGTTVSCDERKNYPLLIRAFAKEFKNSEHVMLKLNARYGKVKECRKLIKSLHATNIFLTDTILTQSQYIEFMNSFDCFINIAKGEGFSLCPREALSMGIPCILSNNTAQKTICKTGFVKNVSSKIPVKANYGGLFGHRTLGLQFNCTIEDVRLALRDVYENYPLYKALAETGSEWVQKYNLQSLKKKYLNLVKPKKVLFSFKNEITDNYIMTNSIELFNKYQSLIEKGERSLSL